MQAPKQLAQPYATLAPCIDADLSAATADKRARPDTSPLGGARSQSRTRMDCPALLQLMTTSTARVLGPQDGKAGFLGSIGVRFMIDGVDTSEGFSLVEHPMSAHALAAPLHRHTREDEYSYVVEGSVGALLGDKVVVAVPGDLIFKPRNQWHTFWNAGDEPARILEIIAPAGFEGFFKELVDMGGVLKAAPETLGELCARYGLEMDPGSVPGLIERFGLKFPGEPI